MFLFFTIIWIARQNPLVYPQTFLFKVSGVVIFFLILYYNYRNHYHFVYVITIHIVMKLFLNIIIMNPIIDIHDNNDSLLWVFVSCTVVIILYFLHPGYLIILHAFVFICLVSIFREKVEAFYNRLFLCCNSDFTQTDMRYVNIRRVSFQVGFVSYTDI